MPLVMWTGRRFRLKEQILATELAESDRVAHYIPKGEIVAVASGSRPDDRLVDLCCHDKNLTVSAGDLEARGDEMAGETA